MKPTRLRNRKAAFTLLELMLVVAIMAIAMLLSYPLLSDLIHRPPLTQATKEVTELCRNARELAILKNIPMELRIYPGDGRMEIGDAPMDDTSNVSLAPAGDTADSSADNKPRGSYLVSGYTTTGQLSDQLHLDMLDVNFIEYNQEDVARVRFYPNGTCDEFTMVVSYEGETRKITLQVVTAGAEVETL